jgi:putative tryptophan/tyrosine transport system substrate-binding protein
MIGRRAFVAGVVTVLAAPLTAESQVSGRVPRVGILGNRPSPLHESFEQGLKELGYEDGRNVIVERRWTQGDSTRFSTLAVETSQTTRRPAV